MNIKALCFGIILALPGVFVSRSVSAQEEHAYYHRALSDLKTARWLLMQNLEGKAMTHNEKEAMRQINTVIKEIGNATVADKEQTADHANEQKGLKGEASLQQCIKFLKKAKEELGHEEDSQFAYGLRDRSSRACDDVIRFVARARHI